MSEIFKNIKGIHNDGNASVDIGIQDDKIIISRDETDQSVKISNADGSLGELKVSDISINGSKASEALDDKVDKVTGKGLSTNDYTDADKQLLQSIEEGAQKNTVTGIKGNSESTYRTGNVNITKNNIGLGNVDNTSDTNKPVSTAQATAIADAKKAGTDAQSDIDTHIADKNNPHGVSASTVGLGNVTNESKATMFTSPAFTGTPTAPTASSGTNTTQIATTAFVQSEVDKKIAAADAMIFKGTIGSSGADVTSLPSTHQIGWTYKVATAGTYAGIKCEIGDMIICVVEGTSANDAHWSVVQNNIDGAVIGPSSSVDSHVATYDGATGKIIKDSGFTIGTSVPSGAKFTDTTYSAASSTSAGLMSAEDKAKLDGIASGATANVGDITGVTAGAGLGGGGTSGSVTLTNAGVRSITQDSTDGHKLTINTGGTNTTITIPDNNTTYTLGSFGITATASELNILDGVTATATELNYMDGVTSNVQTQLDGKAASSHGTHVTYGTSAAALGTSSAGTATTVSRSDHVHALPALTSCTGTLTVAKGGTGATDAATARANLGFTLANLGVTATAAELNKMDGVTATTTELNYVDGVTSNIQTQLNNKASKSVATSSANGLMSSTDKAKLDSMSALSYTVVSTVTDIDI